MCYETWFRRMLRHSMLYATYNRRPRSVTACIIAFLTRRPFFLRWIAVLLLYRKNSLTGPFYMLPKLGILPLFKIVSPPGLTSNQNKELSTPEFFITGNCCALTQPLPLLF